MKKYKEKKNLNYIASIAIILPIVAIFLSVGWSAFNSSMHIDGYANIRIPSEIRVTNFTYVSRTNNALSLYEDYNVDLVTANASFPNENATITYQVQITNMQLSNGVKMGIYSMSGLPTGLQLVGNPTGYTLRTPICDDINSSNCGTGAQKTFTITVGCTSSQYCNQNLHNYAFDINFDFRGFHTITYSNITGFSTAEIMDGDNLVVDFGANAPTNIMVSGATNYIQNTDFTYANGILTITGVVEDITVTGQVGGGGTWSDPVHDTTTQTYDPAVIPVGTTEYDNVEGQPRVTKDETGAITAFEFQDNSGVSFTNNKILDTGVIPFSGSIMRIHLVFDMAVTGNNVGKYVLAAMQKVGTQGNNSLYGGIIFFFRKNSEFDIYASESAQIKSGWFGSSVYQISMTSNSNVVTYQVDMEYDSSNRRINSCVFKYGNTTKTQTAKSSGYLPHSPFNATIHLGGIGVENDHSRDVESMVVKEFSVTLSDS